MIPCPGVPLPRMVWHPPLLWTSRWVVVVLTQPKDHGQTIQAIFVQLNITKSVKGWSLEKKWVLITRKLNIFTTSTLSLPRNKSAPQANNNSAKAKSPDLMKLLKRIGFYHFLGGWTSIEYQYFKLAKLLGPCSWRIALKPPLWIEKNPVSNPVMSTNWCQQIDGTLVVLGEIAESQKLTGAMQQRPPTEAWKNGRWWAFHSIQVLLKRLVFSDFKKKVYTNYIQLHINNHQQV